MLRRNQTNRYADDQCAHEPRHADAENCAGRIASVVIPEFLDQGSIQKENQQRWDHDANVEIEPVFVDPSEPGRNASVAFQRVVVETVSMVETSPC